MSDTDNEAPASPEPAAPREGERIAKRLARAGLCSRRDAERWIAEGRVTVDGQRLTSPAVNVTEASRILVDGQPIPEKTPTRLWRYHKPRGLLTTNRDPEGRRTIFDELPEELPRVITVGRLDYNSEGLLLLTNDGELARKLELPATAWSRRYRVRVNGDVDPMTLTGLAKGVTIEGVRYGAISAQLDRQQGDNAWITMSLTEGKNREVRRICEHLGWQVSRLIRVAYGPFQLGLLEPGGVEEVSPRVVKEQVSGEGGGTATAAEKRRLREQAHDEKRRQKREEKRGAEPRKQRPGKREREERWAKSGEGRRDREARYDRGERAPAAKPFAKRGERSSGTSERPFAKPGRDRDETRMAPRGKSRFEARDDTRRGGHDDRRERSYETREGRSFATRGERRQDAFVKHEDRRDRPEPREKSRDGKGWREENRASHRDDRTPSRDERRDQAGPRDARNPRSHGERGEKSDHRSKLGPGHAHRRRPS